MNINRNNYEEYFMLYADGELDEAARRAVDAFVKQHPDLADELQLFADLRLTSHTSEQLAMPNKEGLLRPEVWDADHLTPTQQQLLNLLDEEVTPGSAGDLHTQLPLEWQLLKQTKLQPTAHAMPQRHRLLHTQAWNGEALTANQLVLLDALAHDNSSPQLEELLQHDEWKKEWHLLQQTRLQPEALVMPGKRSLYRHEETPVVPVNWRRAIVRSLAAAAVMSGLGWFMFSNPSPKSTDSGDEVVITEPKPSQTPGMVTEQTGATSTNPSSKPTEERIAPKQSAELASASAVTGRQTTAAPITQPVRAKRNSTGELTANAVQKPDGTQYYRLTETETQQLRNLHNVTGADIASVDIPKIDKPVVDLTFSEPQARETSITLASYELPAEDDDDERFITIAGARVSKQKIKGLWRSVSRTVVRSASQTEIGNTIQTVAGTIKQP